MAERVSPKRAEIVAGIGFLFQVVFSIAVLLIAVWNGSAANLSESWHYLVGTAFWGIVFVHLRQRRLAHEEELEVEELEKSRKESPAEGKPLFEGGEVESYSARGRLRALEKWAVPAFSVIISGVLIFIAISIIAGLWKEAEVEQIEGTGRTLLTSLVLLAIVSFISFLYAKYSAGMASVKEWRLLRTGGSYLMSNAIFCFATMIAVFFARSGYPKVDRAVAYAIPFLMGLLGLEILLNFILDFYRPRIKGQEVRPPYDSRMLSLVTEPGGILKTVAHTLDYQFGFKVSETWFYRFLEKAIAPLILFQLATLYLLSCFVVVGPDELGVIERFGKPLKGGAVLDSGLHMKWPWPVEKAYRYPAKRMLSFNLGYRGETTGPLLWTVGHYEEEYNYLVASRRQAPDAPQEAPPAEAGTASAPVSKDVPVNLADINVGVYYKIDDLYDYIYNQYHDYTEKDPEKKDALLKLIAERELVRYMVTVDIADAMTTGRQRIAKELKTRIQKEADRNKIGVVIKRVAVENIHPPVEVGDAYEEVIEAGEEREARILDAKAKEQEIIPRAREDARIKIIEAEAYKARRELVSKAEVERFLNQLKAYNAAPEVHKIRQYLSALDEGLENTRKFIIPHHPDTVVIFETEEGITPGLGDLDISRQTLEKEREKRFGPRKESK